MKSVILILSAVLFSLNSLATPSPCNTTGKALDGETGETISIQLSASFGEYYGGGIDVYDDNGNPLCSDTYVRANFVIHAMLSRSFECGEDDRYLVRHIRSKRFKDCISANQ